MTERSGRHPVNAGGGLLARGHPLGATGVAQVVEVTGSWPGGPARSPAAPTPA